MVLDKNALLDYRVVPPDLYSAVEFACSDRTTFCLSLPLYKSQIDNILDSGFIIKNGIGKVAFPNSIESAKTYLMLNKHTEKTQKSTEDNYFGIIGIPRDSLSMMSTKIKNQRDMKSSTIKNLDGIVSNENKWDYIIDRILLYQARMVTPRNIKGYISFSDGKVINNKQYKPYDLYFSL